jgi:2-iminobutanoate/2-iminopropanoate deaminase
MRHPITLDPRTGSSVLSPAMVADRTVYVSGQGPLRDGVYEPGDIVEETRLTLANLRRVLEAAGAGLEDVVRCGVFLADMGDIDAMNRAYEETFPEPRPARTTIQAGALPGGIKVEIDCVALLPGARR